MTLAQLNAILAPFNPRVGPKRCFVAVLEGRTVIVWRGDGPTPRLLRAKFGTPTERREIAEGSDG